MSDYSDHVLFLAKKETLSFHESAHCLAAIKLGAGVERVELFPGVQDDGSMADGITTYAGDFRDLPRADAIKCFSSGPLAERRIGASGWQNSPSDFRRIDNILRGSGLDLKQIMAETEQLLVKWWTEIEMLKYELCHRRVMSGAEIIEAIRVR
jgi:hypothetical protein